MNDCRFHTIRVTKGPTELELKNLQPFQSFKIEGVVQFDPDFAMAMAHTIADNSPFTVVSVYMLIQETNSIDRTVKVLETSVLLNINLDEAMEVTP